MNDTEETTKSRKGFAGMDPEKQRAIASAGGVAAHAKGKAHQFTADEARVAGVKGGRTCLAKYGPDHYRKIGERGGARRAALTAAAKRDAERE